jgi:beta-glucosidase
MSDWFAIKDNDTDNFNSGEDMNMPGKYSSVDWTRLEEAVNNGTVTEARVNDAARRILGAQYRLDQRSTTNKFPDFDFSVNTINEKNKKLNREAAGQSNVLLKNNGEVLPITKSKYSKIAVLGNDAFPNYCINSPDNLCSCKNATNEIWDGHLPMGYGSGATIFNYLIDPLSAITEKANNLGISIVSYGKLTSKSDTFYGVETQVGEEDITGINNLLAQNTDIDLCLIFIMANSGEELLYLERSHGDRYNMDAWHDGNNLVTTVAGSSSCGKKVVVINAPGPINVNAWLSSVDGVVFSGMGAAESGNGIADVLFGDLNPSGHLPYAWGELNQYPGTINFDDTTYSTYNYNEGVFVGQRYFDKNNVNPIFPFGFGLSYTTFTFSGLTTTYDSSNKKLTATFNVKNDGSKDGDVVPMLFLKFPTIDEYGANGYPSKLFKGFDKVFIKSGETKSVSITVDEHALSYYSESEKKFKMVSGTYDVYIGLNAGSDYNKLTKTVNIS